MYAGEDKIMALLSDHQSRTLDDIAVRTGVHIDSIRRIVESLKDGGYVEVETSEDSLLVPTEEFRQCFHHGGPPEYDVFKKAAKGVRVSDLDPIEKTIGLLWAKKKGWVHIEQGTLKQTQDESDVRREVQELINAYQLLGAKEPFENKVLLDELYQRKWVAQKISKQTTVRATGKPYTVSHAFDLSVPAQDAPLGKAHPLSLLTQKIKRVFTELGFAEMEGDVLQSAFWNFDALFQPQDHPARDLADTFYANGKASLPPPALVRRVKSAHEKSWKYAWQPEEARRKVLRTHTTALSARYLANLPDNRPRKYFSVGKVFRNEATDFKHLTEFYQVEGIVVWEQATFGDLLGILKEFYRKLGFERIRFRPSYFPYTEPSLEVEVFFEPRQEWLELGGAGIFRPEVSLPLCNRYPVLAWGLSLERPLLLLLELDDIRTLYRNDLDFLLRVRVPP